MMVSNPKVIPERASRDRERHLHLPKREKKIYNYQIAMENFAVESDID